VNSVSTGRSATHVSVVVGGTIDDSVRAAVADRRRPRVDVLEMEKAFGAELYDFSRLVERPHDDRRAGRMLAFAARRGQSSLALAYDVLDRVKDDDAVYVTGEDVGFPLAALLQLARRRQPRLVVRLEEPIYGRTVWRRGLFALHRQNALRRVDKLLCRTSAHLQYLHAVEHVPMGKLAVVGETVDPTFFAPTIPVTADAAVDALTHRPFIVSAGLERRDYATLIEAVRGLPVQLVIGAGSPWSHTGFDHGTDLPPNVTVSSFSPTQMRELYRSAALVVVPIAPTLRACGMNVVLEAWAMGKAVIATRTVGLVDYIVDGETGVLVPPYDTTAMRSALTRVLDNDSVADKLGSAGRHVVETERNLDHYIARVGRCLDGIE